MRDNEFIKEIADDDGFQYQNAPEALPELIKAVKPGLSAIKGDDNVTPLFDPEQVKARGLLSVEPPPRRYLVEGLMPEPVAAAIVAPGGTGKSFWIMQLGACVASGVSFHGHPIPEPGGVLILAAEDDTDELSRRLHAINKNLLLNHDMTKHQAELLGENLHLASRLGLENRITHKLNSSIEWNWPLIRQIIETAVRIPQLRLIILDPVSRFRAGDENASEDATKFVEALEIIRKETGVTVLCAHHSRKGSTGESQDDIRGSSAFVDAIRFAATLYTPNAEAAKKLGIDESEARDWVRFSIVKSNYQTNIEKLWYRRGQGGVLTLTTAPTAPSKKVEQRSDERYEAFLVSAKELIRKRNAAGEPLTARQLRAFGGTAGLFKMGEVTLRGCINKALHDNEIIKSEDGFLKLY
ncbi:MAG TPA: helicase RepA family protein [Saccharospirillum sp.]|nr:helicase RepA family protein [Saccharospirillum sp.]